MILKGISLNTLINKKNILPYMGLEICAVGGYNEVGKNCTAIKVDEEVVLIDLGIHLENYIKVTEGEDAQGIQSKDLAKAQAIPDLNLIKDWKDKVKAVIIGHGHLDHCGAVPFLAKQFPDAPIISSPYTLEIIKTMLHDEKLRLPNPLKAVNLNSSFKISDKITAEFVYITHSIPQPYLVAIHTSHGTIMYANDFKLDAFPTMGQKTNYARLEELGTEGIHALILDSLYAGTPMKTPSESTAKQMLRDVLMGSDMSKGVIIITTFSSHIARLRAIIDMGRMLKRKMVFMGRSLSKYVLAAQRVDLIELPSDILLVREREKMHKMFQKIAKDGKEKYMVVMTGHQGEPNAVLSRLSQGQFNFEIGPHDNLVFACKVIPSPQNIKNRQIVENALMNKHIRIYRDIHVSGHGAKEDHRELIHMLKPKCVLPSHCLPESSKKMRELCLEMGYHKECVHILSVGDKLKLC